MHNTYRMGTQCCKQLRLLRKTGRILLNCNAHSQWPIKVWRRPSCPSDMLSCYLAPVQARNGLVVVYMATVYFDSRPHPAEWRLLQMHKETSSQPEAAQIRLTNCGPVPVSKSKLELLVQFRSVVILAGNSNMGVSTRVNRTVSVSPYFDSHHRLHKFYAAVYLCAF